MENIQEVSGIEENQYWPKLDYKAFRDTYNTLHRWMQLIGKIKMCRSPWINHSWHTTFEVLPSGFSTGAFDGGNKSVCIDFNFINHSINFHTSNGEVLSFALESQSVCAFYKKVCKILDFLEIDVKFSLIPSEIPDAQSFDTDEGHGVYNPIHVMDFWQAIVKIDLIFKEFRSLFTGKSSPSHFFWGSFDLALTRFSGKSAPEHPAGFPNIPNRVVKEAYSQELASFGFFPGNDSHPEAAFYTYAYPEPKGYKESKIEGFGAYYNEEFGEWMLPYKNVAGSLNPKEEILSFFQSSYEAASNLAQWDKSQLEGSSWFRDIKNKELRSHLH